MSTDECGVCNGIDNNNSGECDYDCSSCDDEISTDYISCTQNDGVWSQMSTDECGVCDTNSENDCSESCVVNYILWQDSYDLFINAQECLSYRNLISQIVISEECIFSYINNDNNETITIDQAYLDSIICEE